MTIQELSEMVDAPIEIHYRTEPPITDPRHRWYADLEDAETKEHKGDGILSGTHGNGCNPTEALYDLVEQLRGKVLVVHAFDKERRCEYQVPRSLTVG